MKNYDEIKEIITQRYGITSLTKYSEWLTDWRSKGGTATQEEADLLSPDNINCRDFWKVCEDLFGTDPICNAVDGCVYTNNMDANRTNLTIAQTTGLITLIDTHKFYRTKMVEYGCGLGCIKNYVEVNTRFDYFGFDVNPRIPDIMAASEDGYLPVKFVDDMAGTCDIVMSTNVLQHVSWKQRKQFFADAYALLKPGCYVAFNIICTKQKPELLRYMTLYGQFILIPEVEQIVKELNDLNFDITYSTTRLNYHYGFVAQKQ